MYITIGIVESLVNKEWVDEREHEVKGFTVNGEHSITEAPRKGRDSVLTKVSWATIT